MPPNSMNCMSSTVINKLRNYSETSTNFKFIFPHAVHSRVHQLSHQPSQEACQEGLTSDADHDSVARGAIGDVRTTTTYSTKCLDSEDSRTVTSKNGSKML